MRGSKARERQFKMTDRSFDVAVIGAGVVGCAIARELARHQIEVVVVEAGADVGIGTSKANTALLHTGFDAKSGSLEAALVTRGHAMLLSYAREANIPVEVVGALMIAWSNADLAAFQRIVQNSMANGYTAIRRIGVDELYRREPRLGRGAKGALEVPDEGIICPFTTPLALVTQAVVNGATLLLGTPVESIRDSNGTHQLVSGNRVVRARHVVNAAGLYSDTIDRMFGGESFTVRPRRGELIVFDKLARPLISHILLPVPSATTKGVLVAPTVFGNVLLGPTAEEVDDKTATESTDAGVQSLFDKGSHIVPALVGNEITAVYAGLRAATDHNDYQIASNPSKRYVCVGGIRSTGLSASMAIAEHVRDLLVEANLELVPKASFEAVRMPTIGEAAERPYRDSEMVSKCPDYGRIVCHCERVSVREIVDALRSPVPARDLDGLGRRTRAQLGRCQSFYCGARVAALFAEHSARTAEKVLGLARE